MFFIFKWLLGMSLGEIGKSRQWVTRSRHTTSQLKLLYSACGDLITGFKSVRKSVHLSICFGLCRGGGTTVLIEGLREELNNKHGVPCMVGVWYSFWMGKSGLLTRDRGFLKDNKA